MMLPLETKQSGGKLPPTWISGEGVFLGEASRKIHREIKLGTWNVRSFYRAGSLEVGCGYVDWIGLAQDRDRLRTLVSTVMNLRVP